METIEGAKDLSPATQLTLWVTLMTAPLKLSFLVYRANPPVSCDSHKIFTRWLVELSAWHPEG